MHALKLFNAVAALAFAGSAFAADVPVANATSSAAAAAAAQVAVAAQAAVVARGVAAAGAVNTRAQIRAEAVEANNNRRASEAGSTDWFMKQ